LGHQAFLALTFVLLGFGLLLTVFLVSAKDGSTTHFDEVLVFVSTLLTGDYFGGQRGKTTATPLKHRPSIVKPVVSAKSEGT
jgi:hypothetical protein